VRVPAVEAVVGVQVVAAVAGVDREQTRMNTLNQFFDRALPGLRHSLLAVALVFPLSAWSQQSYPTPQAAADALVDGIARSDGDAVMAVVGPDSRKYLPLDTVDKDDVLDFLGAWAESHEIVPAGADKAFLGVGRHGWTLPIPIVKTASGWRFDVKAAPEEIRTRRVGRNELAAIQTALAYTDAQEEYYAKDRNGDGVREFAKRLLSSPGKHDGLYWASVAGGEESPLGPEFAYARRGQPYNGYLYRILTAQGKDAPGGAKNYVKDGRMTEGFALIAWPAKYDDTGVMTFIVDRAGAVYQKNLGRHTNALARAVTAYNPDASWTKVEP
jgi:hypothetical protein